MKLPEMSFSTEQSYALPESYESYPVSRKERAVYYLCAAAGLASLGMLFYRSLIAALLCAVVSIPAERLYMSFRAKGRKEKLLEGFRDTLYTVSGSVAAGRQMPAALKDAEAQARASYGADSDICRELDRICGIYGSAHGDIGEMLSDFGERSGLDEIKQFASSYEICRSNGGDVESVCLQSASILLDKIAFRSEARSVIAQKKLDIALLTAMPVLVLLMLNLVSFSYVAPLYSGLSGRLLMSFCLGGIGLAAYLSLKITEIEI